MNRSLRHSLSSAVILAGLCCIDRTGLAGTAEPCLKITMRVYDYAHVESKTLIRAEQEAAQIYHKIGVETVWVDQPMLPEEKQKELPRHQTSDIRLNILPHAMEGPGLQSSSLGLAPGVGHNRGRAYVFYDRVKDLSRKQIVSVAQGKVGRLATMAQILGYAMAHEVAHLYGLDTHSSTGIMREGWRWNDLLDAAYGDLGFTSAQAEVIRREAQLRRQADREVDSQNPTCGH